MNHFYLTTFLVFALWKALSLTLHFFSASPWGGPTVMSPDRVLPDALLIELGLLAATCIVAGAFDAWIRSARLQRVWRALFLVSACVYSIFTQVDQEVVRWLGQHMSLSYLKNYAGVSDGQMMVRIFSGDIFWSGVAVFLCALTPIFAYAAWRRAGDSETRMRWTSLMVLIVFTMLSVSANQWFRPSEKRWRRIRPAALSIAQDAYVSLSGKERARRAEHAAADLAVFVKHGEVGDPVATLDELYPLWRDDNLGMLDVEAFKALPLSERPDIVFIVFETLRAWNTGLVPDPTLYEGSPNLNRLFDAEASYFPFTHSAGFPSVEGSMGLHLGVWPHFRKIIFSDYAHVRSKALPEILRDFGYETHALLGADPSFSNFTPWFERWYDAWEYNPKVHHDGPLVDRFIERYDAYDGTDPRFWMMWTATTHPPYDLPKSEDVVPAEDNEGRFEQAIGYSEKHVVRLIEHLKRQPNWHRTIVVVVGDHAQPTPEQWKMGDSIGNVTPGHTWTVLGILGGWSGLPPAQRYDYDVSHLDVAPTLLSLLNVRAGNHFMGRDLMRVDPEKAVKHPVLSFRNGDVVRQQGRDRVHFRLDSDAVHHMRIDRNSALSYGSLPGGEWSTSTSEPEGWRLDCWRDMIRYYGELLDQNRLMPPMEGGEPESVQTAERSK